MGGWGHRAAQYRFEVMQTLEEVNKVSHTPRLPDSKASQHRSPRLFNSLSACGICSLLLPQVTRDLEQARPLDIKDAKILDTNKEMFDKDGRVGEQTRHSTHEDSSLSRHA